MQQSLIAGDTLAFTTTLPDYPASAGWTLAYRLVPRTAGTAYTLTATPDGDNYDIAESATVTALWTAGEYSWSGYVSKAGERYTVESGTITILPDPGVVGTHDGRSTARKVLDGLLALYETNSVSQGLISEYSIAGRSMRFRDTADLISQIGYWRSEVAKEDRAERLRAGRDTGATLRVTL